MPPQAPVTESPRGRSAGGGPPGRGGGRLPKPPQGHSGYEQKVEPKRPRRDGGSPRRGGRDAKQQMLEAAIEVAAERGYEAMRIREVTEPIGVTRQAFYAHFCDKRHCLAEALDPQLGAIVRMTAALSESDYDSATRIVHALDDLLAERFESPEGTRGRLLSALGRLLAGPNTLNEITIGQIVKEAHVPQGDFYRCFSTKRECLAVHYMQLVEELKADVEAGAQGKAGGAARAGVPGRCSAGHTRHDLPASLHALGEALAADIGRLHILAVESGHLPECPDPERPGAWRGSLTDAIAALIAPCLESEPAERRIRWLAGSVHELIRSVALSDQEDELPRMLAELGSSYAPAEPPARSRSALAA